MLGIEYYKSFLGLFGLIAASVMLFILWEHKPTKISDPVKSTFTCTTGAPDKIGQTFNLGGGGAIVDNAGALSSRDIERVTDWCNDNNFRYSSQNNYQLNIVYKFDPSWMKFLSDVLKSLIIWAISFLIFRSLFLYIATGKFK